MNPVRPRKLLREIPFCEHGRIEIYDNGVVAVCADLGIAAMSSDDVLALRDAVCEHYGLPAQHLQEMKDAEFFAYRRGKVDGYSEGVIYGWDSCAKRMRSVLAETEPDDVRGHRNAARTARERG